MDGRVVELCEKALSAGTLSMSECRELLDLDDSSAESDHVISTAYRAVRERNDNSCSMDVQIGIITGPCIADCGFCSFATGTTDTEDYVMPPGVLRRYLEDATKYDDVESVSLMTIHNFDFDDLMDAVDIARETVPKDVAICINTGDVSYEEARQLRQAGVSRAYHALRIDEGDETRLNPLDRFNTIRALTSAGIEVRTCVEPIGPEHTSEQIVRGFFDSRGSGCSHCSAARRIDVPGTRMHGMGEIGLRRLELIRAVLLLSSIRDGYYGGYYGGFDMDYAEYAGSPKDTADCSELNNGNTVEAVRRRLFAKGFSKLRVGDRRIALDEEYLRDTGSL